MKAPIIILFSLWFIKLLYNSYRHGQAKCNEKYDVFESMIGVAIQIWLLWWAGLFNN